MGMACKQIIPLAGYKTSSHALLVNRRPGILVLINDTDWELEGELDYQIQQGDEIVFISTLHGG